VRQLDQTDPHLREEPVSLRPTTTIEAPVEHLDLATVVKISQALSGEIVLEQLIDTLMTLAVEHAGAERGLLLLPHADALWIAAEATTGRDTVTVRLRHAAVSGVELPESVLHYVLRTQEPVLLDDAAAPGLFAADAYLRQMHVRSVLCLPLVKQARLIGVLYLENRLTSHVFTAARSAVLTLLASQAAIALENARSSKRKPTSSAGIAPIPRSPSSMRPTVGTLAERGRNSSAPAFCCCCPRTPGQRPWRISSHSATIPAWRDMNIRSSGPMGTSAGSNGWII
jgi:transcriptional regulator with GAF, ATPase, and Fis domain